MGDNCSTNKALADLLDKPLVGWRSHRLNLGVEAFVKEHLNEEVNVVSNLMTKLKTLKGAGMLRRLTGLKPRTRNLTRWTGITTMFKRFEKLKPHLLQMSDEITELMPSARQIRNMKDHMKNLENLKKVTVALQAKDMTVLKSEGLFQHIISSMDFDKYLSPSADIVHDALFEKAIIKIQDGNETHLNNAEKRLVSILQKNDQGMLKPA